MRKGRPKGESPWSRCQRMRNAKQQQRGAAAWLARETLTQNSHILTTDFHADCCLASGLLFTMSMWLSNDPSTVIVAAVEGGGTSFRVAVAKFQKNETPIILHRTSVDSSHDDPRRTLRECADFLQQHRPPSGYRALGVATFGPAGVNPDNPQTYGTILGSSPKQAWRNVDLLTPLIAACQGPPPSHRRLAVRFETDVNAPALAEFEHERTALSRNITSLAYVTVGTGVGVGLVVNKQPVHGLMHPEGGHVAVQPLPNDSFEGYSWGIHSSPYGGKHTVEGITSSVALTERLAQMQGKAQASELSRHVLSDLPDDHEVWDHASNALANLCVTLLLTTSMEKIVLGGGIMRRNGLLEKIRSKTVQLLNGYLELPDMSTLITNSTWGDDAGLMGSVVLAQMAYQDARETTERIGSGGSSALAGAFLSGAVVGVGIATMTVLQFNRRGR